MEHTLYVVDNAERGSVAGMIQAIAHYLGAEVQIGYVLRVETDSQSLADAVATVAVANGELLDLIDPVDELDFSEIDNRFGEEESQQGPVETIEKGNGRLLILANEDHAALHTAGPVGQAWKQARESLAKIGEEAEPPDPPAKKTRKPRTYQPKECDVCGQMYTPTGPRSLHQDCPGEPAEDTPMSSKLESAETLPAWERLLTGVEIENTLLQRMVLEGEFAVGERFDNAVAGLHEVVHRKDGDGCRLAPVKKPVVKSTPVGDPE